MKKIYKKERAIYGNCMDENSVLELIYQLEKCNEEYLVARVENALYKKKKQFIIKRIEHIWNIKKYKTRYDVDEVIKKNVYNHSDITCQKECLKYKGNDKIAVYSCISGNYDNILEPRYNLNKNITYIMYTDKDITSSGWEIRRIPESLEKLSCSMQNRYIKLHPHELLGDFDYSIYVDGSIEIISDLSGMINLLNSSKGIAMHRHYARNCVYQEAVVCQVLKKGNKRQIDNQVKRYRKEGFPSEYGLLECGVIVTDLHNEATEDIYNEWWNELLKSESGRDQFSLPYVLWKKGISPGEIGTLGDNLYYNSKIRVYAHN